MKMSEPPLCFCGKPAKMVTSWTDLNPGRRFFGCADQTMNGSFGCRFFQWHDGPICPRSRQVIPGLLRRVHVLEEELNQPRHKSKKVWYFLVVALMIFGWIIFGDNRSKSGFEGTKSDGEL